MSPHLLTPGKNSNFCRFVIISWQIFRRRETAFSISLSPLMEPEWIISPPIPNNQAVTALRWLGQGNCFSRTAWLVVLWFLHDRRTISQSEYYCKVIREVRLAYYRKRCDLSMRDNAARTHTAKTRIEASCIQRNCKRSMVQWWFWDWNLCLQTRLN